jgi:hypothetical protein
MEFKTTEVPRVNVPFTSAPTAAAPINLLLAAVTATPYRESVQEMVELSIKAEV